MGLNAPSGAGCFLTYQEQVQTGLYMSLNAPSGAGCFLTRRASRVRRRFAKVLMHLLVLGAV